MFARVAEFTAACTAGDLPRKPEVMEEGALRFTAAVIVEELMELLETHYSHEGALEVVEEMLCATRARPLPVDPLAEQADALVDLAYFCGDAGARQGMKLDPVFSLVHTANMLKVGPAGKVIRNDRGKVLKPEGWAPPDVAGEMQRQLNTV